MSIEYYYIICDLFPGGEAMQPDGGCREAVQSRTRVSE